MATKTYNWNEIGLGLGGMISKVYSPLSHGSRQNKCSILFLRIARILPSVQLRINPSNSKESGHSTKWFDNS